MSRIRSIHPGLFTDEEYMALSFAARELVKGLWVEADDQGVFEWKLLTIKARIMPADSVDMNALMAELVEHRFVTQFDVEGKQYGAIRNFRTFQRPKKPNAIHPLPEHLLEYVGLNDDESGTSSPPVPHQFPTSGVKPPQRDKEEEGGRKDKKEDTTESDDTPEKDPGTPECDEAVLAWNAMADRAGLSKVMKLTKARVSQLKKRLAECGGMDGWNHAIAKVEESDFLTGKGPNGWCADFDFLLQPSSFVKVMEGKYINRQPSPSRAPSHPKSMSAAFDRLDAELAARRAAE